MNGFFLRLSHAAEVSLLGKVQDLRSQYPGWASGVNCRLVTGRNALV